MRFHSVGAHEGSRIQPVKRKHETAEQPPTPPEIIDDINIEPTVTPVESSLLRFAKKLFGIRSTPKTTPKATPKHESQPKQTVGEKQVKEHVIQGKLPSSAPPHKSPKKKRRKSKPTPQHTTQEQQPVQVTPPPQPKSHSSSSDKVLSRDKQQPGPLCDGKKANSGGGVSELARLYESGNMGRKSSNGGSQQTKELLKERTVANRVSVAMVIEKLEKHRQDGVDTTDYERDMAILVDKGIEEVDAIVLEDIERFATKTEVTAQEEHQSTDSAVKMRPLSNEILDEEVPPPSVREDSGSGMMVSSSSEVHGLLGDDHRSSRDPSTISASTVMVDMQPLPQLNSIVNIREETKVK